MYVYLRVPIFVRDVPELRRRDVAFRQWFADHEVKLREQFSLRAIYPAIIGPGRELVLRDDLRIVYPVEAQHREQLGVPKGLAIRLELLAVLERVDSVDPDRRNEAVFIMIDGSGAIGYKCVALVLRKLVVDRRMIVFGKRPPERHGFMGSPDRWNIELFEKSLLERRYRDKLDLFPDGLPDAQAGCWGLNLGISRKLALTALGYGLEFDLVASALDVGLPLDFTETLTGPERRGATAFNEEESFKKLSFILHKLGLSKMELRTYYEEHLRSGRPLPERYRARMDIFLESPPTYDPLV